MDVSERGREGEREGEKHGWERTSISCLSYTPYRGSNCNPVVCPDQELNPQASSLWDDIPTK